MKADLVSVASGPVSVERDEGPVRVAVFGAGKAAQFHLDALSHIGGVEITGIFSRSGTTAETLAQRYPTAVATSEPGRLIDREVVDAVIVAVPTAHAADLTRAALTAKIPVLVEKPAAPSASLAFELAEASASSDALCAVAVNRRYYSLVLQALGAVRERGPVRGVVVEGHEPTDLLLRNGNIDDEAARDWFLLNSIHFVDLLRLVGGDVESMHSVAEAVRVPSGDHVSASIRFAGGAIGTYIAHWNSSASPFLRIYGEEVTAEVRLAPPEDAFVQYNGKRRIRLHADWCDQVAKPGVLSQDAAFLSAVARGRNAVPFPSSDLLDHARSLQLAESIFRSHTD